MTAKHGRKKISRRPRSGMSAKDVSGRVHQDLGSRRIDYSIPRVATVAKTRRDEESGEKREKKGKRTEVKDAGWKRKRRSCRGSG